MFWELKGKIESIDVMYIFFVRALRLVLDSPDTLIVCNRSKYLLTFKQEDVQ